eukprot:g29444.t1
MVRIEHPFLRRFVQLLHFVLAAPWFIVWWGWERYFEMVRFFVVSAHTFELDYKAILTPLQIKGVVHVGANVGQEAAVYDELGVPKVLWIEAQEDCRGALEGALKKHHRDEDVVAITAVSGEEGSATLFQMDNSISSSLKPLGSGHKHFFPFIQQAKTQQLQTETLDGLLKRLSLNPREFDFMYLDVQGSIHRVPPEKDRVRPEKQFSGSIGSDMQLPATRSSSGPNLRNLSGPLTPAGRSTSLRVPAGTPANAPSTPLTLPEGALATSNGAPVTASPTSQSGRAFTPVTPNARAQMVASLQNGSLPFGSEELTFGVWRRDVADLHMLFQDLRWEKNVEEETVRNLGEPVFSSVSFLLPTASATEEDSTACCKGIAHYRPQTYDWLTGRMSTSRKHVLVFFFMVLEGIRLILAKRAFIPGINMLSILVVENLSSFAQASASGERNSVSTGQDNAVPKKRPKEMFGGIISWFTDLFRSLGLLAQKRAKICFLGLDNAGKTTLLQMLRDGRLSLNAPTLYPNNEELQICGIRFRTFDLDRTRFEEAAEELGRLLDDPALAKVPFAVLGNKIDIPVAASEDELRHSLGLYTHMTSGKYVNKGEQAVRPLELFMCSVVKRMGYAEAFDWLAKLV